MGIAMALRLCRIHWENGFQTGNCSDLFVSSKTFLEFGVGKSASA